MTIAELKLEIIARIIDTDDVELLNKVKEIINSFDSDSLVNEPPIAYEKVLIFNEWQQKRIDIALKQVENGEYLTEEEDAKEMQRWFKEEEKLFGR